MKILGDQQILLLNPLFEAIGEVSTYSGRDISPEQLEGVDALITRSTVNVNESLLAGTNVKFVGTCTIGTDHFDTAYLDQQGIYWTNAAGCNADAVVQYVISAMAQLAPNWLQAKVGIIAHGNIGSRVYRRLKALGIDCCCYDPLLSLEGLPPAGLSSSNDPNLVSLETVLACDIITSHAPLTHEGPHPSYHLLGEAELAAISSQSLLISAGRGAVIDNQALLARMQQGNAFKLALDVWENEPDILTELIPYADIVTPHIAGHSLEGKERGTYMVYQQLCRFLSLEESATAIQALNTQRKPLPEQWQQRFSDDSDEALFNQLLLLMYPIMEDDQRLRAWSPSKSVDAQTTDPQSMPEYFDALRKHYPIRREYTHFILPQWLQDSRIGQWMAALTDQPIA